MNELKGFINIIKPTGMTSSDVVCKIKKILHIKKVGHLGTLDPAASGVLPVAVGKATKFFDYFLLKDKCYLAVVKFGTQTDTLDSFGNITNIDKEVDITNEMILNVLNDFIGEIYQYPPKFSALKVGGKKAYELAREGIEFELNPRKITIFDIKLIEKCEKNIFIFNVHCSAGTYIRTLFSDIATKLNTVAFVPCIIRTKSGAFNLNNAITLDELENNKRVIKIEEIFSDFNTVELNDDIAKKILNGVSVSSEDVNIKNNYDKPFVIKYNDEVVGLYQIYNGKTKPIAFVYDNE